MPFLYTQAAVMQLFAEWPNAHVVKVLTRYCTCVADPVQCLLLTLCIVYC